MCQGVNRTWRNTIVGSINLQRYLFLAAEQDPGVVALMKSTPLSTKLILSKYVPRDSREGEDYDTHCQLVVPNPLIFFNTDYHNRSYSILVCPPYRSYTDLLAHGRLPSHNIDLLVDLFSGSRSDSACLEMFLTQPPVCEIGVDLNIHICNRCQLVDSCCYILSSIKNSKGLRVRDVFSAVRSFYFRWFSSQVGEEVENDITSISIAFEAVAQGSRKGVLLLSAEDMRLAKAEAMSFGPARAV